MSSTSKTLELLDYFSTDLPEIGLSHLCRIANRDKATTYRHLQSLEETGFVEKNPTTKNYRLGPTILQLAQTRENTVPRKMGAEMPLAKLAETTGETSHVTVLSGAIVYALLACESPKYSTRAIIDLKTFPLHATASGLCALAFGPSSLIEIAKADLQVFTQNTVKTENELLETVQLVRESGFGRSDGNFEDDIISLSTPVFDQTGLFAGSVSVASVATRFTPELEQIIRHTLVTASREITRNWGGSIPETIEPNWAATLTNSLTLEPV